MLRFNGESTSSTFSARFRRGTVLGEADVPVDSSVFGVQNAAIIGDPDSWLVFEKSHVTECLMQLLHSGLCSSHWIAVSRGHLSRK